MSKIGASNMMVRRQALFVIFEGTLGFPMFFLVAGRLAFSPSSSSSQDKTWQILLAISQTFPALISGCRWQLAILVLVRRTAELPLPVRSLTHMTQVLMLFHLFTFIVLCLSNLRAFAFCPFIMLVVNSILLQVLRSAGGARSPPIPAPLPPDFLSGSLKTYAGPLTSCGTTCAICLEDFVAGSQVAQLPCGHVFHGPCVGLWLAGHGACPLRCPLGLPGRMEGQGGAAEGPPRRAAEVVPVRRLRALLAAALVRRAPAAAAPRGGGAGAGAGGVAAGLEERALPAEDPVAVPPPPLEGAPEEAAVDPWSPPAVLASI